ncbi:hypothetical protein E2320_008286, partial [Naja naja]
GGRARLGSSCGSVATWALGGEATSGPGLKYALASRFKAGWAADRCLVLSCGLLLLLLQKAAGCSLVLQNRNR